jgi:hypothetical protein
VERVWYAALATPVGSMGVASGERGVVRILLPNEAVAQGYRACRVCQPV